MTNLDRQLLFVVFFLGYGEVYICIAFLYLRQQLLLLVTYLFHNLEALVISDFEITLVTDELFSLVCFRKPSLVLPTSIAHGATTPLAMVTTFLHDSSKLLG